MTIAAPALELEAVLFEARDADEADLAAEEADARIDVLADDAWLEMEFNARETSAEADERSEEASPEAVAILDEMELTRALAWFCAELS